MVVAEAQTGGYNLSTGRHENPMPGCGLADAWGLRELECLTRSLSPVRDEPGATGEELPADVLTALGGRSPDNRIAMRLDGGSAAFGHRRKAPISCEAPATVHASFLDGERP